MSPRPVAHLLCGIPGCGKTTFARQLESAGRAVRFSHDEWMVSLHGNNPSAERFGTYFTQISELIWEHARRVLLTGTDVILDLGFWSRSSRDEARKRLAEFGATCRFYSFDCSVEEARRRVIDRTQREPDRCLLIDGPTFDILLKRFEPMQSDETCELVSSGPNKSLQPTSPAVTPRADARVAPAGDVAEH